MSGYILTLDEAQALLAKREAEIERLRADKEHLLALLRKAANEIDELGFPSKADEFLSAIITCANETERS